MRWSWKQWQKLVAESVTDADALKLAEVWPGYAKQQGGKRVFWAHEMTYKTLPDWSMSRVMKAANVLEAAGLSSRCPGTPLYVPMMSEPKSEITVTVSET